MKTTGSEYFLYPILYNNKRPALKKLLHITTLVLMGLYFSACRKDSVTFSTYPASVEELRGIFTEVPSTDKVTTFTVFPGGQSLPDTILSTPSGVRIFLTLSEALFASPSGEVRPCSSCSTFKVVVTEASSKSDWLAWGLRSVDQEGRLLNHTPAVQVAVYCDGTALELASNRYLKVQLPINKLVNQLELATWRSDPAAWQQAPSGSLFWADWTLPGGSAPVSGYELLMPTLGWVAGVRPLDANGYSSYCISLPLQFDPGNTVALLSFEGFSTVVEMQPTVEGYFCAQNVPLGYPVKLLTLTKAGKSFWIGFKETETATDALLKLVPEERGQQDVISSILSL